MDWQITDRLREEWLTRERHTILSIEYYGEYQWKTNPSVYGLKNYPVYGLIDNWQTSWGMPVQRKTNPFIHGVTNYPVHGLTDNWQTAWGMPDQGKTDNIFPGGNSRKLQSTGWIINTAILSESTVSAYILNCLREAAKKCFFNGSTTKALTPLPPPSSLVVILSELQNGYFS